MTERRDSFSIHDAAALLLAYLDDPDGASMMTADLDEAGLRSVLASVGGVIGALVKAEDENRPPAMPIRKVLRGLALWPDLPRPPTE